MDVTTAGLSNDERGWVMTVLSGIACVFGASVICVDIIIRQFPGKKDFRIQDSDTFLSASLSLSFGVMLFSALYSMLPSSKSALIDGGYSAKAASWILIACFLGGVLGIQVLSKFMHQFMPSHAVECEHSHDEEASKNEPHGHDDGVEHRHSEPQPRPRLAPRSSLPGHMPGSGRRQTSRRTLSGHLAPLDPAVTETQADELSQNQLLAPRRPSMQQRISSKISQLATGKDPTCGCNGSCYGYSEPCGSECFKNISARGGFRGPNNLASGQPRPSMQKSATATTLVPTTESTPLLQEIAEEDRPHTDSTNRKPTKYYNTRTQPDQEPSEDSSETLDDSSGSNGHMHKTTTQSSDNDEEAQGDKHHHHVPSNAFLSIGLQTSIAIALHKLPEGFITYATNHANPKLGFSVFLALFIHNITEGFALALPLYLAINSRVKAMLMSFVLGGLSQPIGAAVAAIWFKIAGDGDWAPSEGVYGGMFAVTAGIMASVALSLFSEALDLTHSRGLCFVSAFVGMGILGVSSALTA